MIYGLLIGLIYTGFMFVKANHQPNVTARIAKAIGLVIFIPSTTAFIGLLIEKIFA